MATTKSNIIKTWTLTTLSLCTSELFKTNWCEEVLPKLTGGGSCLFFAKFPLGWLIWFRCPSTGMVQKIDYSHRDENFGRFSHLGGKFGRFSHWVVHWAKSHWGREPWMYSKIQIKTYFLCKKNITPYSKAY